MEESLTVRMDKSVASLMRVSVWANLICIALLAAVNIINYVRGNFSASAEETSSGLLSPDVLLLLSAVCVVWLLIRTYSVRRTARSMENVFLTIEGHTVSGFSLPEPALASKGYANGAPFTLDASLITDVYSNETAIIKKQNAMSLFIKAGDETYVLPGLERIPEVKSQLLRLMDAAASERI